MKFQVKKCEMVKVKLHLWKLVSFIFCSRDAADEEGLSICVVVDYDYDYYIFFLLTP